MIGFLYALPVVLFFVAVGMLFINLQKPKHLWIGIGIGFLGLIVLMGTLGLVYLSQNDQHLLLTSIEQQAQEKENQSKQSSLLLTQLVAVRLQPSDHFDRYTQYGLSVKNPFFLQLDKINTQLKTLTAKPGPRSKKTVQIYRLPQDSNQLLLAKYLGTLGYQAYIPENNDEETDSEDAPEEETDAETTKTKETPETEDAKLAKKEKTAKEDTEDKENKNSEKHAKNTANTTAEIDENDAPNDAAETSGEDPIIDGNQVVATSTTDLNKLKSLLTFKKGTVNVSSEVVDGEHHDGAHHDSEAPPPPGLDRPALPSANVMYYGSAVSDYDIKVIALAFIRSGVPLRGIRTFKEDRPYDVELDWTAMYEKRPIIPADKILSKKSFDR
jgi:hypothetical protein